MALILALALAALAPALQSQLGLYQEADKPQARSLHRLWIVDASAGGDFLDVQSAIDAAANGDAIEVRPGSYQGFFWDSKDLLLFGSGTPVPLIRSSVVIRHIGAERAAIMRNLAFDWAYPASGTLFLTLEDSPGTLWLEDCTVRGTKRDLDMIEARDCLNVVLLRCDVMGEGGINFPPWSTARTGFRAVRSTVNAYESVFQGPKGGYYPLGPYINQGGGNGAVLEDSYLFASGCQFLGGAPGGLSGYCHPQGGWPLCASPRPGGTGLVVEGTSTAESLDSSFVAGPGRPAHFVSCSTGSTTCPAGPGGAPSSGPVTTIPLPARTYRIDAPSVAGGTYHLTAEGQPGEFLFSAFSDRPAGTPFPLYFGTQLTAFPTTFVAEGTIPASGVLEKDIAVPPLAVYAPFELRFAQGLLFDELANAYLTSGSVLIVR